MWIVPALVIVGVLLTVVICGLRAVVADLRARRWLWALAGAIATAAGTVAVALVVTHASLSAPIGL